jgi:ppGpp synthetase/RelA/SpoT-type nucleotidyltranferase
VNKAELREKYKDILEAYESNFDAFDLFQKHVRNFFEGRSLAKHVHSVRHRLKDVDHLLEKVERKNNEDAALLPDIRKGLIDQNNVFSRITDIAGVRVLHLHTSQFGLIHQALMTKVEDGEFTLFENPKAYTWDPRVRKLLSGTWIAERIER